MKATQKQLLELLAAAGVANVEIVAEDALSDFDMDATLQAVDATRVTLARPTIEQEVTEKIKNDIAGKSGGMLRTALAQTTGISRDLLKDLKDNEAIKLAMEHYGKTLNAEKGDVQQMITSLTEAKDKERDEAVQAIQRERDEWMGKYNDRDIISAIEKEFDGVPLPPKANKALIAADFKAHLASKYHLTVDEVNRAVNLFQKDKNNLPAMKGAQQVKLLDEAKEFLEPRGLWAKDTRGSGQEAFDLTNKGQQQYQQAGQQAPQNGTAAEWDAALKGFAQQQGLAVAPAK